MPIFQNILSNSLFADFLAKNAELLNLKNFWYGTPAAFTASTTGGGIPSANVIIRKILPATSLPNTERMASNTYRCVGVNRAKGA